MQASITGEYGQLPAESAFQLAEARPILGIPCLDRAIVCMVEHMIGKHGLYCNT
jgi:hypothetical protein